MTTGRTLPKWMKVQVEDSGGVMRDIPVNTASPVGFTFEEIDVSALQEANKSFLAGQGSVSVTITGPLDNTAAQAASGTGAAPALSGSHIVLSAIATPTYCNTGRTVAFYQGIQGYWATGDPVFGGVDSFIITEYTVDLSNGTYSAKFAYKSGATAPAWGTAALAAS